MNGGKEMEFSDFLPQWWTVQETDEDEEDEDAARAALHAKANRLFAALGGKPASGS